MARGLLRKEPHRSMAGAGPPAIKNPHREAVQVGVFGVGICFRGGDGARVHLRDCRGGGLCCAARCLGCSTHSRPQVTSAGAKPNHGFFNCQQPVAKKNSPTPAATSASGRSARAPRQRHACRRSHVDDDARFASCKKCRVLCGLCARVAATAAQAARLHAHCTQRLLRRRQVLNRRASGTCGTSAGCASQQPECAKVRKNSAGPRFPRTPFEAVATMLQPASSTSRAIPPQASGVSKNTTARHRRHAWFTGAEPACDPGNESGRTWRPERNDAARERVSGLLPRAVRRRRPGRAAR